jgi:proline racemase
MDLSRIRDGVAGRFPSRVLTVDSHTAGEPTRLILDGIGPLPGGTVPEKRRYFMENLDHVRLQLTREPRGHRDMIAAVVTEPCSQGADFGLIYMDARRYPQLCGHATMGAVTTLIETGALEARGDEKTALVDTPSGPMETKARIREGRVESVAVRAVPSFVCGENETLEVPGLGQVPVDTVYVGGFFAMIPADRIGLELTPANAPALIDLGMRIIDLANRQLTVRHPTRPDLTTVDVAEFYDTADPALGRGKGFVVYGEAHMDRSPCGTGTTAKLTLFHHRGHLGINQPYFNTSPLGTTFEGRLLEETRVGDLRAVVAEIRGSAHITGIHEFVLDPHDPFPEGFLI